ncbi:M48 family metallopeptidase [Collinsella sp. AF08-23]|uniref:M48 family metallopeptidase n=1 Tax=Collinsella sp. AF08-23 TaxID=2292211 RepID=UPI000E514577|nr:SprT family zinc-dependent metalloprotease [Collinsella sp. AF08-23]RHS40319.1 M48 family peptidase [Collinsella sp. AF08-23]
MSDTRLVLTLHADGLEIPVKVTRKHVKNLNLRVRGDGSVALSIPQRLSFTRAQAFLDCKASWIIERVRRAQMRNTRISPTEGESDGDGRTSYPLWGDLTPLGFDHGSQDFIDNLYREELGRVLPRIAARLERRMGVRASRWSIRTMKTRWGSCTPSTGAIRINARLAAYPPECLEFVVAHELVHLLEPSHNARFHALLDEFCPDNRALARRLRQGPVSPDTEKRSDHDDELEAKLPMADL